MGKCYIVMYRFIDINTNEEIPSVSCVFLSEKEALEYIGDNTNEYYIEEHELYCERKHSDNQLNGMTRDEFFAKIGHWIEIEHYSNHGDEYCDCICSKCDHRISRPSGLYPNFCEDCGSQMLCLANTRDLTDEESAVYDKWLNYKAKKTGDTLW